MILTLLANVARWPDEPSATKYELFLMVLLYQLALQFLSLVVFRAGADGLEGNRTPELTRCRVSASGHRRLVAGHLACGTI